MNDKNKKRRRGNVGFVVDMDTETGEYEDYFWSNEDHDPPPLIKPKKDAEKKRRPS